MLENGTSYPIKYKITGGKVSNMDLERSSDGRPSLIININIEHDISGESELVLEIPNILGIATSLSTTIIAQPDGKN
jgi:hypothetical protein